MVKQSSLFDTKILLYQNFIMIAVTTDKIENVCFNGNKKSPSKNGGVKLSYKVSGHGSSVVYVMLVNLISVISRSVGTGSSNCKRI